MARYWIEMALFMHLVLCLIGLYGLLDESTLKRKVKFLLLIVFLPLAGFLIFEESRKKKYQGKHAT
jgi:hypothetical protein